MTTRSQYLSTSVFRLLDLETNEFWVSKKGRHTFCSEQALKHAMRYGWFIPEKNRIVEFKLTEVK